jgi:signal transduction histidine kinase
MAIRAFLKRLKENIDYEHSPTFKEELNRKCNALVIPGGVLATFSWLLYIPLDRNLYSELPIIIYLRLGLCLIGFVVLVLHFTPYFKTRGYLLMFLIVYYVGYAAAIIVGMTGADPVYMGGLSIVIMLIALVPLQRSHAYFLLFSTLLIFFVIGALRDMTFKVSLEMYGLYNIVVATAVSIIAIIVFDRIRKNSHEKSLLIKEANEELKKANKIKSEMLEIAAHDLKDPLQVIIGYTDLLQMKLKGDVFAIEKLNKIYKSTDQMIRLITGLLEIASIESGRLVLNRTDVDLGRMAEIVIKNNRPASGKKKQEIVCHVEKNCAVNGDEMLLQQMMENLINNAIKFSPPGKHIWVSVTQQDAYISFKVRDEGPGLTEEDKRKVFGKFQRLSAKPTARESSSGLGLALTQELVKLHGGTIRVESEWGKGSEFIMELPRTGRDHLKKVEKYV